jgi:voltage-gated potassium channel
LQHGLDHSGVSVFARLETPMPQTPDCNPEAVSMSRSPAAPQNLLATIVVTSLVLGLIALAIGGESPATAISAIVSATLLAVAFHFLLPGSSFFSLVFANCIGIYACLYVFLSAVNFAKASVWTVQVGFVLPLAGFALGVVLRRDVIRRVVLEPHTRIDTELTNAMLWIAPLIAVAIASFLFPFEHLSADEQGWALIFAMSLIAVIGVMASRDIAVFLIDTGILFEDFSANARQLIKPAFAFFTWYSLLVIIFACLYTIIDRYSPIPQFIIGGESRDIFFSEALYVSIVTLSTVGFGDIVPRTPAVRMLVATEIFVGILLLLFGVQAVLSASKKSNH